MEIDQLEPGMEDITIDLYLSRVDEKEKKNGEPYLILYFQDSTGKIEGRKWRDCNIPVEQGDVVSVNGEIVEYKGNPQIKVSEMWDNPGKHRSDFVETTEEDPVYYYEGVRDIVEEHVEDEQIKDLVYHFLAAKHDDLLKYPASRNMHHSRVGGLIQHIYSMLSLSLKTMDHYDEMHGGDNFDRDLVIAGIVLHDLGKMEEYTSPVSPSYGERMDLEGHISIILDELYEYKMEYNLSTEKHRQLKHIILSHHGRKEWGSPVEPATTEAQLVHRLDMMDSRVEKHVS